MGWELVLHGKIISTKVQKIIMWIPFINASNFFIFIFNAHISGWTGIKFLKGLILAFLLVILTTLVFEGLKSLGLGKVFAYIINLLYIYVTGILVSYSLIRYQRKRMEE